MPASRSMAIIVALSGYPVFAFVSTSTRTGTPARHRAISSVAKRESSMNQKPVSMPTVSARMRLSTVVRQSSKDESHNCSALMTCAPARDESKSDPTRIGMNVTRRSGFRMREHLLR